MQDPSQKTAPGIDNESSSWDARSHDVSAKHQLPRVVDVGVVTSVLVLVLSWGVVLLRPLLYWNETIFWMSNSNNTPLYYIVIFFILSLSYVLAAIVPALCFPAIVMKQRVVVWEKQRKSVATDFVRYTLLLHLVMLHPHDSSLDTIIVLLVWFSLQAVLQSWSHAGMLVVFTTSNQTQDDDASLRAGHAVVIGTAVINVLAMLLGCWLFHAGWILVWALGSMSILHLLHFVSYCLRLRMERKKRSIASECATLQDKLRESQGQTARNKDQVGEVLLLEEDDWVQVDHNESSSNEPSVPTPPIETEEDSLNAEIKRLENLGRQCFYAGRKLTNNFECIALFFKGSFLASFSYLGGGIGQNLFVDLTLALSCHSLWLSWWATKKDYEDIMMAQQGDQTRNSDDTGTTQQHLG